jgi:hypothetical protein
MTPSPRAGLAASLEPHAAFRPDPPPFVDADAALYAGFYMDAPGTWQTTVNALGQLVPVAAVLSRQILANPQADVNFERDVLQGLGRRWFVYVPAVAAGGEPADRWNAVWGVDVKDPKAFADSFARFLGLMKVFIPFQQADCEGRAIHYFGGGRVNLVVAEVKMPPMALCVTDGHLLTAARPSAIERVIRASGRSESPLLASEAFRRDLPALADHPAAVLYADHRQVGRLIWPMLGGGAGDDAVLPPFETVARYLSVQTGAAEWDKEGLLAHTRIPILAPQAPGP